MANAILSIVAIAGGLLALGALLGMADRENFRPRWLIIAAGLVVLNDGLLTNFWGAVPHAIVGDWNWQGKLLATAGSLAIASLPMFGWRKVGITLHQGEEKRGPTYGVIAAAFVFFVGIAFAFPNDPVTAETVAFQATMPGIEEELFYRGILLLALNEAFRGRVRILGIDAGYSVLLLTILFGMGHAFSIGDSGVSFDPLTFAITAIPSLILIWVRERTGSIIWPIILHNVANTLPLVL